MMISASQKAPQTPSPFLRRQPVMFTLGRFGMSLIFLAQSPIFLLSGAMRLGLIGPTSHLDNSQHSRWLAAAFLVLGGCQLATGLLALVGKLNQKAA
jgi:hypothetical protein